MIATLLENLLVLPSKIEPGVSNYDKGFSGPIAQPDRATAF